MALVIDPAKVEVSILKKAVEWNGKYVLEVGCGAGRLTKRLAGLGPRRIVAIDSDADQISAARRSFPKPLKRLVTFRIEQGDQIKYPASTFDIALFSWVL